jgi:hypothetical protein
MFTRWNAALAAVVSFVALSASVAEAQLDPVEIYPLPGGQSWTAIPGSVNMDSDPADEVVLVFENSRLAIVDSATGQVEFDSEAYGWIELLAPGWDREGDSTYYRNHGYDIFCDEDGDGVYCVHIIVSSKSQYEHELAVICLDRGSTSAPAGPRSSRFDLGQSFPNPLRESATIQFTMATADRAVVRILDVQGRLVRTLLNDEILAGRHTLEWDGRNDSGSIVSSGMYYYELEAGGERESRKAILIR